MSRKSFFGKGQEYGDFQVFVVVI